MKKLSSKISFVMVILFIVTSMLTGTVLGEDVSGAGRVKVIIAFDNRPGQSEVALIKAFGGKVTQLYNIVPAVAATVPEVALKGLARNPHITIIEPDMEIHALSTEQELLDSWGVDHIDAEVVHAAGNTGATVKVAVLDSGIDYNHPDLKDNFKGGKDFVNGDLDPYDDHYHGTHVAGTIAAIANSAGVIGVAPDVEIYALKVLDSTGSGNFSWVIAALDWCVANGIQVTNNSYGSSSNPGSIVEAAFNNAYAAGIIHIGSAGNNGNVPGKGDNVGYPGAYASVVAVAATDRSDARARFSSTGPDVEIAAPGVSIYSTVPGGGYNYLSGTSMASPHVAGVAALIISSGTTGPDNIREKLQLTAIDLGAAGRDEKYGFGLVDPVAATGGTTAVNQSPVVSIANPADGASYDSGVSVTFTGSASDAEDGDIGSSLQWTSSIDGPIGSGVSISASLRDGVHTITADVVDSESASGSDTITISIGTPPVGADTASVSEIIYSTSGGKNQTAHLEIYIGLADETDNPIAGAVITIDLYLNGILYATNSGTTDSLGIASYKLPGAPSGTYSLIVELISAVGYTWDGITPANNFSK